MTFVSISIEWWAKKHDKNWVMKYNKKKKLKKCLTKDKIKDKRIRVIRIITNKNHLTDNTLALGSSFIHFDIF